MADNLPEARTGHGGDHAVAAAVEHGADTMFTLSGAHVFPMYDAGVKADPPLRLVDVRHEQTAVFAAEAMGKLTRVPGLAVLTAGPGVTNGVSPITQAYFSGSPLVVVGGRAPDSRWGMGSLQELDQPPLLSSVTKSARTAHAVTEIGPLIGEAFAAARTPHRGPAFVDVSMDAFFDSGELGRTTYTPAEPVTPDPEALELDRRAARRGSQATRGARDRRVDRRGRSGSAAPRRDTWAFPPSPTGWDEG